VEISIAESVLGARKATKLKNCKIVKLSSPLFWGGCFQFWEEAFTKIAYKLFKK
jgi:hypothetical protein